MSRQFLDRVRVALGHAPELIEPGSSQRLSTSAQASDIRRLGVERGLRDPLKSAQALHQAGKYE